MTRSTPCVSRKNTRFLLCSCDKEKFVKAQAARPGCESSSASCMMVEALGMVAVVVEGSDGDGGGGGEGGGHSGKISGSTIGSGNGHELAKNSVVDPEVSH